VFFFANFYVKKYSKQPTNPLTVRLRNPIYCEKVEINIKKLVTLLQSPAVICQGEKS